MSLPSFFKILKTASSEVRERTLFKNRFTRYIPDLFLIMLNLTVFLSSASMDLFFLFHLFLNQKMFVLAVIYVITIIIPGLLENFLYSSFNSCLENLKINRCFQFLLSIIGFSAAIYSSRACGDISMNTGNSTTIHLKCFTFPFFNIKNDTLSIIRVYFLINAMLKSMPRLFLLPIILLHEDSDNLLACMGVTLIMLNMVIFSLAIATTFPIRPTPRVFTSSICVVFSAFNKFMAAMTSCSIILVIFSTLYKKTQLFALLFPASRTLIWAWPSWNVLYCQTTPLKKISFIIYFISLAFFFSFIYIHPFEGVGKLHYYLFYFMEFLTDLLVLYLFTDASLDCISNYLVFKIITIAFISNFELVNLLHKYSKEKSTYGCITFPIVVSGMPEKSVKSEKNSIEITSGMQSVNITKTYSKNWKSSK